MALRPGTGRITRGTLPGPCEHSGQSAGVTKAVRAVIRFGKIHLSVTMGGMAIALEVFFDQATTSTVRALWQLLEANGIPSEGSASHGRHQPHVTLLNVQSLDVTASLARTIAPLIGAELVFDSLAVFPGSPSVLFLGVRATRPLLDAHAAIHASITTERANPWYEPGTWVPHCGLALGLDAANVTRAFALLLPFQQLKATITEVCAVNTVTGVHSRVSPSTPGRKAVNVIELP
jgi:2'-5' RNA ligase